MFVVGNISGRAKMGVVARANVALVGASAAFGCARSPFRPFLPFAASFFGPHNEVVKTSTWDYTTTDGYLSLRGCLKEQFRNAAMPHLVPGLTSVRRVFLLVCAARIERALDTCANAAHTCPLSIRALLPTFPFTCSIPRELALIG